MLHETNIDCIVLSNIQSLFFPYTSSNFITSHLLLTHFVTVIAKTGFLIDSAYHHGIFFCFCRIMNFCNKSIVQSFGFSKPRKSWGDEHSFHFSDPSKKQAGYYCHNDQRL